MRPTVGHLDNIMEYSFGCCCGYPEIAINVQSKYIIIRATVWFFIFVFRIRVSNVTATATTIDPNVKWRKHFDFAFTLIEFIKKLFSFVSDRRSWMLMTNKLTLTTIEIKKKKK